MEPTAKLSVIKSTTVRSVIREATVKHGLAALGGLAPELAALASERMFLTPRRFPRPTWEQEALLSAQRGSLVTPQGELPIYSWGSGPTVLLVHGWEGRGSQMSAFVPALVKAGYRALAVDMPGHGDAQPALSSAIDFARALAALIPQLPDLTAIIGHSMGAAATALAYTMVPIEARLVLVSPPRGPRGFLDMFKGFLKLNERTSAALERRLLRRFGRSVDSIDIALTGRQVQVPTLVIHDRGDKEVAFSHGQLYAATLPSAQLLATEGLGHRRVLRDANVIAAAAAFVTEHAIGTQLPLGKFADHAARARMAVSA
jgi:pimeloyl-ACP methyl ester carboxylesterase